MSLLDVLAPPACAACNRYGSTLCEACRRTFRPAGAPADRFVAADPGVVAGDALDLAVAAFVYEGSLRRSLARLKYGGAARVAAILAAAAAPALAQVVSILGGGVLVPVPVHADRLRIRGYNQAELLARALGGGLGLPIGHVLIRRRPTTQQHRLDRAGRLRNLQDAFALAPGVRAPSRAILVDDILTTSATLEACASVLVEAGSERVIGFTIAREM
ncbi:MAG TPA: ComF family protein [candidate division Zixibacteria bacterium]|nr:ComF family protein [candidate division Zixibacteria bacterium]